MASNFSWYAHKKPGGLRFAFDPRHLIRHPVVSSAALMTLALGSDPADVFIQMTQHFILTFAHLQIAQIAVTVFPRIILRLLDAVTGLVPELVDSVQELRSV